MSRLLEEGSALLGSMKQKVVVGSVLAMVVLLLSAIGLIWLGLALHWALAPEVGPLWAWLIPAISYLAIAATVAFLAFRPSSDTSLTSAPPEPSGREMPAELSAERLAMELGRELERETRRHPLRAASLALLGGAVLGASPEVRRGLRDLLSGMPKKQDTDHF